MIIFFKVYIVLIKLIVLISQNVPDENECVFRT